jgi:hypothetical protein
MRTASLLNPVLSHKRDTPGRSQGSGVFRECPFLS